MLDRGTLLMTDTHYSGRQNKVGTVSLSIDAGKMETDSPFWVCVRGAGGGVGVVADTRKWHCNLCLEDSVPTPGLALGSVAWGLAPPCPFRQASVPWTPVARGWSQFLVCVSVHRYVPARVNQNTTLGVLPDPAPPHLPLFNLNSQHSFSLASSWASRQDWSVSKLQGSADLRVPHAWIRSIHDHTQFCSFKCGFWGLNSGSHLCKAGTLLAELFAVPRDSGWCASPSWPLLLDAVGHLSPWVWHCEVHEWKTSMASFRVRV